MLNNVECDRPRLQMIMWGWFVSPTRHSLGEVDVGSLVRFLTSDGWNLRLRNRSVGHKVSLDSRSGRLYNPSATVSLAHAPLSRTQNYYYYYNAKLQSTLTWYITVCLFVRVNSRNLESWCYFDFFFLLIFFFSKLKLGIMYTYNNLLKQTNE